MRILLIGHGKMGKLIQELAQSAGHTISAIATEKDPLTNSKLKNCDVAIDFSSPEEILKRVEMLAKNKTPVVIGTTGWQKEHSRAKTIINKYTSSAVIAPNFSIGVNLFLHILKNAAPLFNHFAHYDVAIAETHHNEKKDHPSGTAKAISSILLDTSTHKTKEMHELTPGAVDPKALQITSIRSGYHPGKHEVIFDGPYDTITLTHAARSRQDFAKGALVAAEWILDKQGYFTMEDVLCSFKAPIQH